MNDLDTDLPKGIALTVLDERYRSNPYNILDRIRRATPLHHDDELNQHIATHHDDVKSILRDKDVWSDPRKGKQGSFIYELLGGANDEEPSMLLMDEPNHKRLRSLVSKPFMPSAVERWRPRTRQVVTRILDGINESEFDLIKDFANPIPTVVIAELLGIDASHHDNFKIWSDQSVKTAFSPFPDSEDLKVAEIAQQKLDDFFLKEIEVRRKNLGDDLLSELIRAEEEGDKLSQAELVLQCNLMLIAGNVTTTDLIGNGIKALLDNPQQLQLLKDDPSLIKNAVEEMLRFDSPVLNSARIPNRDMDVQGCPIGTGESLIVSLASANRDPNVYPDPDTFDIKREDTHHQSFGGGRHMCLGAHLARLEAQEAILAIITRYPDIKHSQKGFVRATVPSFRGMESFWVTT
jgi:cytochrome P450